MPIAIFGVIMQAPFAERLNEDDFLPNRFRYLVQRIQLLAEEKGKMATIMFDGSASLYGGVGWQFNGYLYRSDEGRACTRITDAPSFVDSKHRLGYKLPIWWLRLFDNTMKTTFIELTRHQANTNTPFVVGMA